MPRNANQAAADAIVGELARSGVTDACVSAGSRSSALVLALARSRRIRARILTDERSAGFFALGLARETARPVALLSTSGTAAANYLPAVAEASLGGVPLVVLTADRPPELRDCGAAQTIQQPGLFGAHVRRSFDVAVPGEGADLEPALRALACRAVALALGDPPGPVHVNLPMREPLFDPEEASAVPPLAEEGRPALRVHAAAEAPPDAALEAISALLEGNGRGILVCGAGSGSPDAVTALAARLDWPILADPLSGLRFGTHDRSRVIDAYDLLLRDGSFRTTHAPDAVMRLGRLPASKALEGFLASCGARVHVVVAPPGTLPDPLHRATELVAAGPSAFAVALAERVRPAPGGAPWMRSWSRASTAVREAADALLAEERGLLEGKVLAILQRILPEGAALHVGNSMPVRDAEAFLGTSSRALAVVANRGANGIDGVLSTALGAAAANRRPVALVLGDLSFLHDAGALQIAASDSIALPVVVVDNDGGGIFSMLPQARLGGGLDRWFTTPHGLDVERLARSFGARARRVADWAGFAAGVEEAFGRGGLEVIVVPSDKRANARRRGEIVEAALERARAATAAWGTA